MKSKLLGHRAGLDTVEVAGGVGDREHGQGSVEVAGRAAAVCRQEMSLKLVHIREM